MTKIGKSVLGSQKIPLKSVKLNQATESEIFSTLMLFGWQKSKTQRLTEDKKRMKFRRITFTKGDQTLYVWIDDKRGKVHSMDYERPNFGLFDLTKSEFQELIKEGSFK